MAINFEAANMAGYNNPKIEVFKVTMDSTTNVISAAPSKTEIISCLNRGSIPALMVTSPDGSEGNLLWVISLATGNEGDNIIFGNTGLVIFYSPNSDSPAAGTGG